MRNVCVFLGSNTGNDPAYLAAAREVGAELARRGLATVYGGSTCGCMGALAAAAIAAGGRVIGVIPESLHRRVSEPAGLAEERVVGSMSERKDLMTEISDAFIALPGGLGTLEELAEILTGAQLGFHKKPCGLLNVHGYYDGLLAFLDQNVRHGFLRPEHRAMVLSAASPAELLEDFERYVAPTVSKWMPPAAR